MSNTTATQILFIDSRVADADVLLAGLDPAVEIVRLNATESGLQQMANVVQGRSNISSVHVISHGGPGNLLLGSGVVNQSQLAAEQSALSTLQSALSEDADLLLYGCDVAAGAEGQSFINALAAATGADVAASTDLTGGGSAQSDWELESSTGAIETAAIDPVGYQYDLGYWGNVGLTNGDRWNVYRGSQYTIIFDADGGGKGSKYGVANNVGAYNVSNLYTSGYNGDWEAIWYTFTGSSTAVPGSPWYVSNWDPDAGGYTYWGAYANSTPWQVTGSVTLNQGQSQTLFVGNLVNDDYYSSGDIWKYLVGASAGGYVSSSSLSIGNSSAKYATFYAPDVQSWKDTVYLGSITYSVNDGVNYSVGGSLNPDYYSAYSRYKSATYTTAVYGTYVDDLITWNSPPANQSWVSANKNSFNFGRGAQDPDSSDYVTGYSLVSVQEYRGGTWQAPREANGSALTEKNSTTGLPNWLKLSGTTLYVDNLAPENAGRIFKVFVRASSSDGRSIDRSFELTTGSADVVNNKPTSPGNAFSVNEAQPFVLGSGSFSFVDLDNTVGKSVASGAVLSHIKISGLPTQGQLKIFDVVSTPLTVTDGGSFKTVTFTDTTSEMVISVGTTTVRIPAPSGPSTTAQDVAAAVARAVNYDKLSSYTATALSGADAGKVKFVAKAGANLTALTAENILSLTAPDAVTGDDSSTVSTVEGTEFYFPAGKKLVYVGPSASGSDSFQYYVHDGVAYSTNPATMAVTVKEVNEPPTLTVSPASIAVSDVAALSFTLTPVTGSLAGVDPDGRGLTASEPYGIQGVTPSSGVATKVGNYGTLTVNTTTGAWTYTPNAILAINRLTAAETAQDAFQVTVKDIDQYSTQKTLTATITGVNNTPVVAASIGNQTFAGSNSWTYNLPSGIFFDADGDTATGYTVTGHLRETAKVTFSAAADDVTAISFSLADTTISIAAAASRTATVVADAVASQINANASATYTAVANAGVVTLTAKASGNLGAPTVSGDTTSLLSSPTVLSVQDGTTSLPSWLSFNSATGQFSVTSGQNFGATTVKDVTVSATIGGHTVTAAPFDLQLTNAAPKVANPIAFQTQNVVTEKSAVTFSGTYSNTSFVFDGVNVTVAPERTGAQIADAFFAQLVANATSNYNVTKTAINVLTFTAKTNGDIADLTISGTGAASAAISVTQGTAGAPETTTVTFANGSYAGATITLDGVTAVVPVVTATEMATAVASVTFPNFTAVRAGDVVTFTSKNLGDQTNLTVADFPQSSVAVATTTQGAVGVSEVTTATFSSVAGGTAITFGGVTSTINPNRTGAELADAFFARLAANSTSNYNVTKSGAVLTFTAKTTGVIDDLKIAGTGAASAAISVTTEGASGVSEVTTVTFSDGTYAGATITLDGVTAVVPLATGTEVATVVAANMPADFTATSSGTLVTITKTATGEAADLTSSSLLSPQHRALARSASQQLIPMVGLMSYLPTHSVTQTAIR